MTVDDSYDCGKSNPPRSRCDAQGGWLPAYGSRGCPRYLLRVESVPLLGDGVGAPPVCPVAGAGVLSLATAGPRLSAGADGAVWVPGAGLAIGAAAGSPD